MPTRIAAALGLLPALLLYAAQQPTTPNPQSKPFGMSMSDMMKNCRTHCQRTKTAMSEISKVMADAEKSNDPEKLRSAPEQAQKSLSQMQGHMDSCMSMKTMMHDHMGGMMQNEPKK